MHVEQGYSENSLVSLDLRTQTIQLYLTTSKLQTTRSSDNVIFSESHICPAPRIVQFGPSKNAFFVSFLRTTFQNSNLLKLNYSARYHRTYSLEQTRSSFAEEIISFIFSLHSTQTNGILILKSNHYSHTPFTGAARFYSRGARQF